MDADGCALCGLPATDTHYPPLCAGCAVRPFSDPASRRNHRARFGPPEGFPERHGTVMAWDASSGAASGEEYRDLGHVLVGLPIRATFAGAPDDLTRFGAGAPMDELAGTVWVQDVEVWPWREVVLYAEGTVWVEAVVNLGLKGRQVHVHGPHPHRWNEDMAEAKRGLDMLGVTRRRGNPGHSAAERATSARKTREARRLIGEGLTSAQAAQALKVNPSTLRGWLAEGRDKGVG